MISSVPFHSKVAVKAIDNTKSKLRKIISSEEKKLNYAIGAGLIATHIITKRDDEYLD